MMPKAADLLEFIHECGKLKQIQRTGWLRNNIKDPESVADHSFRVAVMCLLIDKITTGNKELDICKMLKMALLHDLAEASTGDITPSDGISREKKLEGEFDAMKKLLSKMDGNEELLNIWEEYSLCRTEEARMVFAVDKLEMAISAVEYEKKEKLDLSEFYNFSSEDFPEGDIREIFNSLLSEI